MPQAWLTPNGIPPAVRRFFIEIPDSAECKALFIGCLLEQTKLYSWEAYGLSTPQEAVDMVWREIDSLQEVITTLEKIAIYADVKAYNAPGGTSLSGQWSARDLNTEMFAIGGIGSQLDVSKNWIIVQPGTYHIRATTPAYRANRTITRIGCHTDTIPLVYYYGQVQYASEPDLGQAWSEAEAIHEFASEGFITVSTYTQTGLGTAGLGVQSLVAGIPSIFAKMTIRKLD